jgi:hypothetical protein
LAKRLNLLLSASAFLLGAITAAHADVVISTDPTSNISCSGGVCTPTAADAVLNVSDLESYLASGSLEVTTTGSGVQANNIDVTAPFSWSAANTLTLDAFRSVTVSAAVTDGGNGGLSLTTRDGGVRGGLTFSGGDITVANTSSALTIDGKSYTLVNSIAALAAAIAVNGTGRYALANNYDASGDGTYAHSPVAHTFTGTFEGLGNAVSNMTIRDKTDEYVGLFKRLDRPGLIRDIGVLSFAIDVSKNKFSVGGGAVVGYSTGTIVHAFASGEASGQTLTDRLESVGGIVGINSGTVADSVSAATIDLNGDAVGGSLVGQNLGTIRGSGANGNVRGSGKVSGGVPTVPILGGLVGMNFGFIDGCRATGTVNVRLISGAFSAPEAGGLVGENENFITRSSAAGMVASTGKRSAFGSEIAGLAGVNAGAITLSFATGAVTSEGMEAEVGGLVGLQEGEVIDSYATGAATGADEASVGGLVGFMVEQDSDIPVKAIDSFSTGAAMATGKKSGSDVGGFAGQDQTPDAVRQSYWNVSTSDLRKGTGNRGNEPGLKGLTTTELQSGLPNGFDPKVWAENPSINNGFPYLIANPPPQ